MIPIAASLMLVGGCATTGRPDNGPFSTAQVAAMHDLGFAQTNRGWEFSMADRLLFATDSSAVLADQTTAIDRMSKTLAGVGITHAEVEGHTDRTGTTEYNEALSQRRAGAVADIMAAGGMPRDGIKAVGLGERFPVESNATAAGRRENRRVVILITAP